ncbi:MAG: DUF3418 domain-containing protein, partial [Pseudomonadota bacterium]
IALIKTLPKAQRRNYVPAVNFAEAALEAMPLFTGDLLAQFARQLHRISGIALPEDAWQLENLPPHLRMNFRIVDEAGKVVEEGRDLVALQEKMAGKVRKSLHTPAQSEWERDGIKEWDVEGIPESVQLERHGLKVNAFPAYSDAGDSVALKLFERIEVAEAAQRGGVVRLFLLANHDKVRYLRKNLPGIKTACLHYVSIGKCEELSDAIIRAAAEQSLLGEGARPPRSRAEYERLAQRARAELVERANKIAEQAAEALAAYHRINKQLKGAVQPQWLNSIADIREQLEHLLPPGFPATTAPRWLNRLPRYLQAVDKRLEKLRSAPERDRQLMLEMQPLWQKFWRRCEQPGSCDAPELVHFRWLLEELRISLFAQELGTVERVSVPRLEKQWKAL